MKEKWGIKERRRLWGVIEWAQVSAEMVWAQAWPGWAKEWIEQDRRSVPVPIMSLIQKGCQIFYLSSKIGKIIQDFIFPAVEKLRISKVSQNLIPAYWFKVSSSLFGTFTWSWCKMIEPLICGEKSKATMCEDPSELHKDWHFLGRGSPDFAAA